ncbi:hypothetical protein Ahy_A10g049421 isoform A [Arachis hypogaea]|uniref:RING-type domain-containing protein n=1 Tax=Arachis hypogaea TaxID=3818 RepID=A0A445B749_ARAHY|nr:hypothetical protein Ahy_A10g049421 isoform A [Arachis hypogaea]
MDQSGGIATGPRDVLGVRSGSDIGVSICKPLKNLNGKICQICGDTVGLTATGDVFVACQECSFPLCHRCYECECENGNQSCPQCKTRYNSHKDSSHLEVDEDDYEDDDDVDDIENEVNYGEGNINKAGMQWEEDADLSSSSGHDSRMPNSNLHITNGQPVILFMKPCEFGKLSGEKPCATPDTKSVQATSGPLGPSKANSLSYTDSKQPGIKSLPDVMVVCQTLLFFGIFN